ncbi:MAG: DUF3276 family protein [Bacteroidota bacterium]
MGKDFDQGQDSVYTNKVRAGRRRTYFFDVRKTKGEDFYITLTESTKRFNGDGYSRHKLFLYKEDFNRFLEGLEETIAHVKEELMPDYDYEQFDRRQAEWEQQQLEEKEQETASDSSIEEEDSMDTAAPAEEEKPITNPEVSSSDEIDEDMSW